MNPFIPFAIITAVMFLLALGIVVFVVLYQKRLMKQQLYVQEMQQTRQLQLLEAMLEAQESERRRIARDLHDEVGTMLALLKLQTGQYYTIAPDGSRMPASELKQQLDDIINNVRRISHDLMPVVLNKLGLVQAIIGMKRSLPPQAGVQLFFDCKQPELRFTDRMELTLYRMVQELLNNTIKHAGASEIHIALREENETIYLSYKDNGIGYDVYKISSDTNNSGNGLMNLQSRVALLNGNINFESSNGYCNTVTITVPLIQDKKSVLI